MGLANIEAMDGYVLTAQLSPREFAELIDMDIEVANLLYSAYAVDDSNYGALLGGIMGFDTDDVRIRDSFEIAGERGIAYSFLTDEKETDVHPNTVDIRMVNDAGTQMCVRGESLGGGKVRIVRIIRYGWSLRESTMP